jgi:hypothetical protein
MALCPSGTSKERFCLRDEQTAGDGGRNNWRGSSVAWCAQTRCDVTSKDFKSRNRGRPLHHPLRTQLRTVRPRTLLQVAQAHNGMRHVPQGTSWGKHERNSEKISNSLWCANRSRQQGFSADIGTGRRRAVKPVPFQSCRGAGDGGPACSCEVVCAATAQWPSFHRTYGPRRSCRFLQAHRRCMSPSWRCSIG